MSEEKINDVTDTAAWVATYRARESQRADALFHDPLAAVLAGQTGEAIAKGMKMVGAEWYVVIRTRMIDTFIQEAIDEGIDTVINLGAGLDTRPYRLTLPKEFLWIEVDFPKIIEMKNQKLKEENPNCRLERIICDLSNDRERSALLDALNKKTRKALVLTEGVLPYLTEEQVQALGRDLYRQPNFALWIVDYFSSPFMKIAARQYRRKQLAKSPFVFFPKNWEETFLHVGWKIDTLRYMFDESEKLGRNPPHAFVMEMGYKLMPKFIRQKIEKLAGFALLRRT